MKKIILVSSFVVIVLLACAFGEPKDSKDIELTTLQLRAAAFNQLEGEKHLLDKAYKMLMEKLEPERKAKFREAQKAWEIFLDKSCEFVESGYEGGSLSPVVRLQTATKLTQKRTDELMGMILEEETP